MHHAMLIGFTGCSTPFGIKEGFTLKLGLTKKYIVSAQRLSASKKDSPWNRLVELSIPKGAQRLSASKKDSPQKMSNSGSIHECSTPFGIKEGFTSLVWFRVRIIGKCSTPFGIKEGFTGVLVCISSPPMECSTPFGIKEGFTYPSIYYAKTLYECSTPFGIKEGFTRCIIQEPPVVVLSAQRLSASKKDSQDFVVVGFRRDEVLNAFRHQRRIHFI